MNHQEVDLATLLAERMPSMELTRFTASGTEATLFAVRLARAYTGRKLLARMSGSYHGLHDMMSTGDGVMGGTWLGLNDNPVMNGVLPEVRDGVVFMPFNDLDACSRIIERHRDDLATVIVEPFMGTGGGIPAEAGFLKGLRKLCDQYEILLTFDEMISIGMAPGGAQEYYDVVPDLTTTGKLIGGGMPIGAFGGKRHIMKLLEPVNGIAPVLHTGTWNGHPVVMAAGVAQMKALDAEAYRYLGHIGDYMREQVRKLATKKGVAMQALGIRQFSAFHYTSKPVRSHADTKQGDVAMGRRVALSLLSQGFFMLGGRSNLSTAITESDIDRFIDALAIAFYEAGASAS
jgi:glutamate-1-semialdehyde 2,1-aminomutase